MLSFVICDDNLNTLNQISNMLENIFIKNDFDAKISFKTTKENELINYINNNSVDVLVLDIQLSSKSTGLDIANKVREHNISM